MKKIFLISALALGACAQSTAGNIELCTAALLGAGTSDPSKLLVVALATPACVALGQDVLNELVNKLSVQQRARGVRP